MELRGCQPVLQVLTGTLRMERAWRASLALVGAGQTKGSQKVELFRASHIWVCEGKLFSALPCVYRWACTQVHVEALNFFLGSCSRFPTLFTEAGSPN